MTSSRIFQNLTTRYALKWTQNYGSRRQAKNVESKLLAPSPSADDVITKWIASNTPWITQFQTEYGAGKLNMSELVRNLETLLEESPIPRGRELSLCANKATTTNTLEIYWESSLKVSLLPSSVTNAPLRG